MDEFFLGMMTAGIEESSKSCINSLRDIDCSKKEEWSIIFGSSASCENATEWTSVRVGSLIPNLDGI